MSKLVYREELLNAMKELTKDGFKCFILKENSDYMYGFIITPSDDIIYIQRDTFEFMGWTTTLQYKPSRKNGSGCRCLEEPFQIITKDQILLSEIEGLKFARKLKAELYTNSKEYTDNLWNKEEYEEVINND